jgi:tetratricopeptide (TPR) repeat protein
MVHYLQNTPEMGPRVNTYMAELNRGKDPIESFAPAMGMTVDEFSSLIRDYYKAGRLAVTTFKSPVNPKAASITVKDISEAEGKMHLLDAARLFASSETATAWADKIENRHGSSYLLHLGRARLALEKQDESSALISVGKALQLQPNAPEALRVAAAAQLAGYRSNSGGYVESARDYAQRLMQASPNDPFANYVYALSFGRDANDPRAVKAANIALNYYRDMRFAETNLNLIDILVRAGQTEGLKKRLYFSSIWARDASARSAAREMLKRLPE